jgi:tellurite resistance protein TerC
MEFEAGRLISVIIATLILDLLLDGDNALIIAAMVSHLPKDEAIPWPRWTLSLKPLTRVLPGLIRRLNDNQQNAALQVGIAGAILGRLGLLLITGIVIQYPIFTILGAVYLIQLGARHLGKRDAEGDAGEAEHRAGRWGFWRTVVAVNVVDVAFSLDNVVALVALTTDMLALTVGIGLAVILMRMAALVFIKIMKAHPILEPAAYILVLYLGVEILLEHKGMVHMDEIGKAGALMGIVGAALLYEKVAFLHPVCRPFFRGFGVLLWAGVAVLDGVVRVALWPFRTAWSLARGRKD